MAMPVDAQALQHESEIVWLEPINRLDYVRQTCEDVPGRSRKPSWRMMPGRLVGYSVLRPDTPSYGAPGRFYRRVFWLKEHDRDSDPHGVYGIQGTPTEAVDPATVHPGVVGVMTDRARGGRHPSPHLPYTGVNQC